MKRSSFVIAISLFSLVSAHGQTPAPVPAPAPTVAPAAEEGEPGPWKSLFDGKAVNGLRGLQKPDFLKAGWKIVDNTLTLTKSVEQSGKVTGGDLITTEAYSDFDLDFQYKLTVSGDTGIQYLVRGGVGQKLSGMEFQIIDDVHHPDGLKGGPIKRTGALYGLIPPSDQKSIDDKSWNEGRLIVRGNHVEHWINAVKVVEYDLGSAQLMQAAKDAKLRVPPGWGFKFKSPIVILDQGEEVAFRMIRIRTLAPPAAAPGQAPAQPPVVATPVRRVGPTPFKSRIP